MSSNNSKQKKKKDRRDIKRSFAGLLFMLQAFSLVGAVINGMFFSLFTRGIAYLIGFFSCSIVAVILLISAHKEAKRIAEAELLEETE